MNKVKIINIGDPSLDGLLLTKKNLEAMNMISLRKLARAYGVSTIVSKAKMIEGIFESQAKRQQWPIR